MELGLIGLGRIGANMAQRLLGANVIADLRREFGGHAVKSE